jgi:PiT family inorganic phosphate transporter
VAGRIIWAWIFTIPASAAVAAVVYGLTHLAVGALAG